jgi:hypothetical protein
MIAVEVRINGKLKVTYGLEDLERVSACVSAHGKLSDESLLRDEPEFFVESHGLHTENGLKEVLKWNRTCISIEDEINIKFVEIESVDAPIDRQVLPLDN